MNGITVNTNTKENNFAIALSKNFHHQYFTSIKVYHNFNSAYHFNIDVNSGLKYKQTQLRKEGYSLFQFESPCDSVSFLLEKTDTTSKSEFTLYGFSLETNEPGFYYADMGFNGASTKSYIDAELLAPQLKSLSPDLIIFLSGLMMCKPQILQKNIFIIIMIQLLQKLKALPRNVQSFLQLLQIIIWVEEGESPIKKVKTREKPSLIFVKNIRRVTGIYLC